MKSKIFLSFLSVIFLVSCETPVDPTDENPTDSIPSNGLAVNQYKFGSTVFNVNTLGWQANGYSGYSDGLANHFKAIFSKKGPETGTYKVVSVATALSLVAADEIGIHVLHNYLPKAITPNTGTAKVTHNNGVVKIQVNDVTMGTDKFSAYYVIGDANRYIYVDNNSLDPEYAKAKSEGYYSNVHMTKIETYGSQTSDSEDWGFVFYFGAVGLADGTYSSISLPSNGLQAIPAGKVYVSADKGYQAFKSDETSGTVTVSKNKISFSSFTMKAADKNVVIRGEYQF